MIQQLKNLPILSLLGYVLAVAMLLLVIFSTYQQAKKDLQQQVLVAQQQQLKQSVASLIKEQHNLSTSLALAIANRKATIAFLEQPQKAPEHPDFAALLKQVGASTGFDHFWIQFLDQSGHSRFRSWTKKVGDSLVQQRIDLQKMLRSPQLTESVSVGKYSLTSKSMVPVYNSADQFIGVVEVIAHFPPLLKALDALHNVDSIVLADARFKSQLVRANKEDFIQDYFVVSTASTQQNSRYRQFLQAQDLANLVYTQQAPQAVDLTTQGEFYLLSIPIMGERSNPIGYWLSFTSRDSLDFSGIEALTQKTLFLVSIVGLLLFLVSVLYRSKQNIKKTMLYYENVLNAATEIIYVTDYKKIIQANQRFFDFFDAFTSIAAFLQRYRCVCDTFEAEPGYLQPKMDGDYWIDYMLKNPHQAHRAKIKKAGKMHVFEIRLAPIYSAKKVFYCVIMLDVTQQVQYEQNLFELSHTDTLTGVANRRTFESEAKRELQREQRYQNDLALLMFDIDFFKRVNDQFGHDVGDHVLVALAQTVQGLLRETDLLCRIGGEEFVVLMPETSLQQACKSAERIRSVVAQLQPNQLPTPITLSFGVTVATQWDSLDTFLKRADDALYFAKQQGRNQVQSQLGENGLRLYPKNI